MGLPFFHNRGWNLHHVVVNTQPALTRFRRNNDSPFNDRAAFDLLAYFMIKSGPNSLGDHCILRLLNGIALERLTEILMP